MNSSQLISDYLRYNHWANEQMTGWLKTLDANLLHTETPSSFNTIDRTLQHMTHAQDFWIAVVTKSDLTQLDDKMKVDDRSTAIDILLTGSKEMIRKFEVFSEEELHQEVSSPDVTATRYKFMLHVVNHNQGIPNTDYDAYLWSINKAYTA